MDFLKAARETLLKALKCWVIGMVIGVAGYCGYEIGSIYWKNYELETATRRVARLAATNIRSGSAIHDDIYEKAQQLGLPVQEENIVVNTAATAVPASGLSSLMETNPQMNNVGIVAIEVSYAVPVRFSGYTLQVKIHFHADDRSI